MLSCIEMQVWHQGNLAIVILETEILKNQYQENCPWFWVSGHLVFRACPGDSGERGLKPFLALVVVIACAVWEDPWFLEVFLLVLCPPHGQPHPPQGHCCPSSCSPNTPSLPQGLTGHLTVFPLPLLIKAEGDWAPHFPRKLPSMMQFF